jgi:hypothetical protein
MEEKSMPKRWVVNIIVSFPEGAKEEDVRKVEHELVEFAEKSIDEHETAVSVMTGEEEDID